jgi:hypothetical protein
LPVNREVARIRAQIEIARPLKRATGTDEKLLENAGPQPRRENTATREIA